MPGEVLHLRKPLFQHGEGFLFLLSGVQRGNAGENRFNGPRLFGEVDRLFEQPGGDMLPARLAGAFPTLQVGVLLHHTGVKIVLPLRQIGPVADNFFGAQAVVLCQRHKDQVQMGRFFIHVYHSRNDVLPAHPVNEEVRRPLEVGRYLLWGLALEKLRAGGNQRVHKPSAVLAGAASGLLDAALNEMVVAAIRLDDVEIVLAPVVAVLTGNLKWRSQTAYLFIKGAIIAEEMEAAPDHIDFSENQWKQIQEAQKEYFEDQEIVGWFFSQPQLLLKVSEVMLKVHMKHFGGEKVLMLMEPQEREDAFFRYENNEMVRLGGYYLYYEKNPGMQTYMIDKNEELQPEPQEKYEDQAVKDFRKIIADKKETRKEPAAPSVFSYGLTACLAIAVLTVGVNFYRSYQNVKQNEKESATVSSVIVEEITPSPVVGTSNNEAVRQHKQYRTDTIQNDAGKNKKNNEKNDEENNQSTSEKENSEKKNNTSEKKISAEQTDTEQKSDKTEQLPDVKTEKADKTEQIYQQEADERKAQKRVREAVQKENSEAAGKAHESYVIQPGDTLFQISMDRYGSIEAISQICKLNGMSADEIIYPGQVIVLP